MMRARNVVFALLLFASCATRPSCDTLYFGTAMRNSAVTPEQWKQFNDEVIAREFAKGSTTWEADGRWRDENDETVSEHSYVLFVVGADGAAIARVIAEYKRRFSQESVMRVSSPCRATF
jgi:hypothetical protein